MMLTRNWNRFHAQSRKILSGAVGGAVTIFSLALAGQTQPALQITSPTDGTIVAPGQTISVNVTAIGNISFKQVFVIGQQPLPVSSIANSVPAQFSIIVPQKISEGKYLLTASGITSANQDQGSSPITIDVERPDVPTRLTSDPDRVIFGSQGETEHLRILATFSDGTRLNVTRSSYLTFTSSNTAVATVDQNALIRAVAKGSATITATYTVGTQSVTASVPVSVPPPVTTSTPTALDFGNQNVGTSSSSQTVTITNVSNNQSLRVGPVGAFGDFTETDTCTSSSPLAVGGMCTINVSFAPTATGSRMGAVRVVDSMDIVPQPIPLSGTGIGQQPTTATITSSANPSVFGQATVLATLVTPSAGSGTPTGSVTFDDGANPLSTVALSSGQAAFSASSLTVGSHSITAVYGGDANFLTSTSTALSQVVNQASTTTTLTSSANPSALDASVTLTANLSVVAPGAGAPTGSITFHDGSSPLATVPVSTSGQATLSSATLAAGSHSLTASYGGDTNFKASSGTFSQQVAYGICVLYDQTRSVNSGATFPIKVYLCDVNGNDVSSSGIVLHATGITNVSGFAGPVQSPGNANPDNDFRYDSTLGPSGGYIFNLSTAGLTTGTYSLQFTAGADPTPHAVSFGVQ